MMETEPPESPLESVGDSGTTRAFSTLGNETRLAVMLTLWDEFEPYEGGVYEGDNTLTFSELYDRIEYDHPGNFSYHLKKLTGQFIRRVDEGYQLTPTGRQIMYAIIAGTINDVTELTEAEIEVPCYRCGASTTLTYDGEFLFHCCTECEGRVDTMRKSLPDGTLNVHGFPPAGHRNRSPDDVLHANLIRSKHRRAMMIEGVCPECAGEVGMTNAICNDHESEGICSACGHKSPVLGQYACEVCKHAWQVPPETRVATHPAVIGFYHERGVEFDLANQESRSRMADWEVALASKDPVNVHISIPVANDKLTLILDDQFDVVESIV